MSIDLMEKGLAEVDIFEDRKAIALDTIENKVDYYGWLL